MKILDVPQTGRIGNVVSYKTRYGVIQRRQDVARDPRTYVQVSRRVALKLAAKLWATLTDEQRAAWRALARGARTRRHLNHSGPLSGYLLFVKINCNLAAVGFPRVLDTPPSPRFGLNPVRQLIITNTNGAIALKLSLSGQPPQYVIVLATKPRSAGVSYVDHFSILALLPDPVRGVSEITDLFVARYGVPRVGSRVFIQTLQQINGWQDLPQLFSALVPTPWQPA
jgi:hypothetical protein